MADLQVEKEGFGVYAGRLGDKLRLGEVPAAEFCGAMFEIMTWEIRRGKTEEIRQCMAQMPREVLGVLADFVVYLPEGYLTPSFRRMVKHLQEELKGRGGPVEGERQYLLPERDVGGLSPGFWDRVVDVMKIVEKWKEKGQEQQITHVGNLAKMLAAVDAYFGPMEFCWNLFSYLMHAALEGDEEVWRPCLEKLPRNALQLASDYANAGYVPIDYAIEYEEIIGGPGRVPNPDGKRAMAPAVLRRFHKAIDEELRRRGGPVAGEVVFELPKRNAGDPLLEFWMVKRGREGTK